MGALKVTGEETKSVSLAAPAAVIDFPRIDQHLAEELQRDLGVGPIVADVLVSRGLHSAAEARAFLSADQVPDLSALGDVDTAAEILACALAAGTRIAIHGDYDCDGISSTALLTRALRSFGLDVIARVPERADGYGLSVPAIDELAATGAEVLLAVDCGITATAEVDHAKSLGMEVIIVDHHRPRTDGVLPDAAIVHPTLAKDDGLPMCAAAVATSLVGALAARLAVDAPDCGMTELAGLATVTDVMPLIGANRRIVRDGISSLRGTQIAGLAALIDSAGVDRATLTARDLGWTLGPRINAAGRVRAAGAALELLLTDDAQRAAVLAAELEAANAERRAIQKRVRVAAEIQAAEAPRASAWVLAGEDWHPGVVGIVAGQLAQSGHRPTAAIAVDRETGHGTGSVRSVPGYDVAAAVDACSDLLLRHGGHAAAAGLTIEAGRIAEFRERFARFVDETLPLTQRRPRARVDAVVSPSELTLDLAEELDLFEPVGEGNPEVALAVRGATLERPSRMGAGKHARFAVTVGDTSAQGVAFNARERVAVNWSTKADVVGTLEVNRWNGSETPRFRVERAGPFDERGVAVVAGAPEWLSIAMTDRAAEGDTGNHLVRGRCRREASAVRKGSATIARLVSAGETVLVVVADVARRAAGLKGLCGGFSICDWQSLEADPSIAAGVEHLVLLDPPARRSQLDLARSAGEGWLHRAWGVPEIRFALRIHESNTDIEQQLRPFFKDLRAASSLQHGSDRIAALRGPGRHPRSAVAVSWMLAVLREIGVAEVDRRDCEIKIGEVKGDLATSVSWRRVQSRLEEGRSFLLSLLPQH